MRLIDLNEVKLTFYLPNAEIGAVTNGRSASVTVDAYPAEHFAGKVTSIAMQAAFTPRNIQTRTDRDRAKSHHRKHMICKKIAAIRTRGPERSRRSG